MIRTELVSNNVLRLIAPKKLKAVDFQQIAPEVDSLISRCGKIRLLIDATLLSGWENMAALENHAAFIKDHQQKVDRVAIIIAHDWQRWLVGGVKVFLHPEVRAYDAKHKGEALQWVVGDSK